jgi:hypothetical protein
MKGAAHERCDVGREIVGVEQIVASMKFTADSRRDLVRDAAESAPELPPR